MTRRVTCATIAPTRRGKTANIAFRQPREPRAITRLSAASIERTASLVQRRVVETARARGCCCYVFVREGQVYVLSEELAAAHRWAATQIEEWVGCYGGTPDLETLADDLRTMLTVR